MKELIAAAEALLLQLADQNGNMYSDYTHTFNINGKIRINRLVKQLFNETQKAKQQCQTKN